MKIKERFLLPVEMTDVGRLRPLRAILIPSLFADLPRCDILVSYDRSEKR